MKSDRVYLQHMVEAVVLIEGYIVGKSFEDLPQEPLLQDGLVRQLTIVGEAARRLSPTLQEAHPEIPWSDIVGMRHILIHDYFDVDLQEVWKTVRSDLPVLKKQLEVLLQNTPEATDERGW